MTGPEHFAAAEADIAESGRVELGPHADWFVARAQVHATLALVAATGNNVGEPCPTCGREIDPDATD